MRLPQSALVLAALAAPLANLAAQDIAAAALQPAAVATPAAAASPASQPASRLRGGQLIALNPIGALLGYYSISYERAFDPSQTVGFGVSYIELNADDDGGFNGAYDRDARIPYFGANLQYRYYPRRVYRGVSLGANVGVAGVRAERSDPTVCDQFGCNTPERRVAKATTPTFGFELGYNWLLGEDERLHIGTGIGARRYFVNDDRFGTRSGGFALPSGRLSMGLRF